ncbi:UNVERIFIED_CONTAM: hypothetical protein RMT77_016879 [Armadillidium vulgare]
MKAQEMLSVYKQLLRESQKFSSYNYREYALKRIKDGFKEYKDVTDEKKLLALRNSALENLQVIKRQVLIGQMYSAAPLVIEKKETNENKS